MPLDQLLPMVSAALRRAGLWREEYEAEERDWFARTVDMLRARYRTLIDFAELGRPYFSDEFVYEEPALKNNLSDPRLKTMLPELAERIRRLDPLTHETAEAAFRGYAGEQGAKAGLLINAARTALTGQAVGPGMFDIILTLGRERTADRLLRAADLI